MLNIADAFQADPAYFKKLSVKNSLIVNYNCPQIDSWADLYTDFNHIIYTVSGTRQIIRPEKSIEAKKGSITFLRKSAFQQGKFHEEAWQVIVFAVHDDYLRKIVNELQPQIKTAATSPASKADVLFEISTNDTLEAFFFSVLPYFKQQPPPGEKLLELKMRELILNILSDELNAPLLSYIKDNLNDRISAFVEVMEANYMYNLSLAEFAKLTHHSLTTFKKTFGNIFKESPGKWLLRKRLEAACIHLKTSEKPVLEVAYRCGFESITHFNRAFKEKYLITPLQYRKK